MLAVLLLSPETYDALAPLLLGMVMSAITVWLVPMFKNFDIKVLSGLVGVIFGTTILGLMRPADTTATGRIFSQPTSRSLTFYLFGFILVFVVVQTVRWGDNSLKDEEKQEAQARANRK